MAKIQSTAQIIGIIVGIVVGILVGAAVFNLTQKYSSQKLNIDKVLVKISSEMNENLPAMIDAITRLDNVMALPNKAIQYNYTLISADIEDLDIDALKKFLEQQIININTTNPDLKYFRDNNIIMKYYYKDEYGKYLFTIVFDPEQHK